MSRMSDTMEQSQAGSSTEQLKHKAAEVSHNLREMGGHLRSAAREQYQHGRDKARELEEGVEQYVQDKPLRSLLIAAGIGMLAGLLWRRR